MLFRLILLYCIELLFGCIGPLSYWNGTIPSGKPLVLRPIGINTAVNFSFNCIGIDFLHWSSCRNYDLQLQDDYIDHFPALNQYVESGSPFSAITSMGVESSWKIVYTNKCDSSDQTITLNIALALGPDKQPCLSPGGIVCGGNGNCNITNQVDGSLGTPYCTCYNDPVRGYWECTGQPCTCTTCKDGYSIENKCRPIKTHTPTPIIQPTVIPSPTPAPSSHDTKIDRRIIWICGAGVALLMSILAVSIYLYQSHKRKRKKPPTMNTPLTNAQLGPFTVGMQSAPAHVKTKLYF